MMRSIRTRNTTLSTVWRSKIDLRMWNGGSVVIMSCWSRSNRGSESSGLKSSKGYYRKWSLLKTSD